MLERTVVQHIPAGHQSPFAVIAVVVPPDALGVIPLLLDIKGAQGGDLIKVIGRRGIVRYAQVQFEVIECTKADDRDGVFVIGARSPLELVVVVNGQKREPQCFKNKLQIAPAHAKDERRILTGRPLQRQAEVAGSYHHVRRPFVRAGLFETELHHRAECVAAGGWKGPCIEIDVLHQIDVDHPHRSAACTLGGKVVDVGDFDPVDVETVLVRRAATNDNIVAETRNGRHTRQGAEGAADVTSAARVSFDLISAKAANTQRRFRDIGPPTAHHFSLFYRDRGWLEDHVQCSRSRRRHLDFEHRFGLIAHEADLDVLDACGHIHQLIVAIKISRCAHRRPLQNHISKRDGFVRLFIIYPASDDAQGLGRCRGS